MPFFRSVTSGTVCEIAGVRTRVVPVPVSMGETFEVTFSDEPHAINGDAPSPRDEFAKVALASLLAIPREHRTSGPWTAEKYAQKAYELADAMMIARGAVS